MPVPVVVGPVIDGLRVIKSGLSADSKVIIRGQQRIMPGVQIQPKLTRFAPEPSKPANAVAVEQRSGSATFAN